MDAATGALETIAVKPKKTNITMRTVHACMGSLCKGRLGELKPAWE